MATDQPGAGSTPATRNERTSANERADRAFTLYCRGMRPAAIAAEVGASETSVRRWLRASLRALADETRDQPDETAADARDDTDTAATDAPASNVTGATEANGQLAQVAQLVRAIESQRAIAHAAWDAYERERAVEDAILRGDLDRVRRRALRPAPHDDATHGAVRMQGASPAGRRGRLGHSERGVVPATPGEFISAAGNDGASGSLGPDDAPATGNIVLEEYERPRHTSQGARYLAVALAAQREVARLQGLYERIEWALPGVHIILSRRPGGPENAPPTVDEHPPA